MQIAVVNLSKSVDARILPFLVKAWDQQAAGFALDWSVEYTPVVLYDKPDGLPLDTGECRLFTIQDSLDVDGALGYHDDELGVVFARILAENNCEAGSHEVVEEMGDPTCGLFAPMGNGRVAKEAADPVEGDSYPISVTIGTETRDVSITNYVLPSWFNPNGTYPFDKMGKLSAPFTMTEGGYMVVRAADGSTDDVFAKRPRVIAASPNDPRVHAKLARKIMQPETRLARRLFGSTSPVATP